MTDQDRINLAELQAAEYLRALENISKVTAPHAWEALFSATLIKARKEIAAERAK